MVLALIVLDAGPIVALLNRRDAHHPWARDVLKSLSGPFVTCEAVVAEASYLLRNYGSDQVVQLGERGFLAATFSLQSHWASVRALMRRYANVPMSLADACIVRMSEIEPAARVVTLDTDFSIYRRSGRQVVPTIMPDKMIR
jgi:predicted nucleic acid-binding protein